MYSKITLLILLVISSFFFSACNDEPTSAGLSVLNKEDLITISPDSTFLVSASSFKTNINYLGGNPLLLGNYRNIQSTMLVNFVLAATVPDTVRVGVKNNNVNVTSAWVEMIPKYKIGTSASQFDFSVYRIISGWPSSSYFNLDSLGKINRDAINLKSQNNFSDSLYTFNLNTQTVSNWVKDSTNAPLYFDPSSSVSGMVGFQSMYNNTSAFKLKVVFEKSGVYKDTVTVLAGNNLHLVKEKTPTPTQSDRITIQAGIGMHSHLKFDLSKVPATAIINSAVLELTMDPSSSILGTPRDTLLSAMFLYDTTKYSYDSTKVFTLAKNSGNVFSGDISSFVQKWILKQQPNNGIAIGVNNERGTASLLSFMGKNTADRPKLKIIYTNKKQ